MDEPHKNRSADQLEISKPAAKYSSQNTKLIVPLLITAIVMLFGMSLYQLLKLLLLPNISLIESNIITILFSSAMATFAAYFIFRKRQLLLQQTLKEITERMRADEEITKLNKELKNNIAQLEAANKELESFSYSVSHDLRAPLRHIIGYVELLQKNVSQVLDAKSLHYLTTISDSAKRMGILIDDLLSFSRIGRVEMREAQFSLEQLIKEVLSDLEPEMEGRKIQLEIRPLPDVYGDRPLMKLVFLNMIANAIKFTSPREQARIEIGTGPDNEGQTVIFVRDNGVGFDMKYTDKLFEIFQRLHSAGQFEGTGIGLANVQRIIHRHRGKTWAEGSVDEGATFYVSIPKAINGGIDGL
ncbi:MAG: ATP-binding protein [Desulfobulbaceae bacterium]|nr:ATP-binding protein [Desulfobulbaceae bacterium]